MATERKLFGTDGIRGKANVHPMTGEVMMELGRAFAQVFKLGKSSGKQPKVLIAKDTRRSGYMLEDALAAGLCSMGVHVLQVGPIPTPGLAFLTVDMRCDAGAMITASHNRFDDNGIKFFSGDGFKLPDDVERRIEDAMYSAELERQRPVGREVGRAVRIDDAAGRYIVFLKKTFPREFSLEGLRIAVDCANGAAYRVAPTVLEELGAEVVAIGNTPNGVNINEGCGAQHPANVARTVREYRADLGIALDGDADRVILVDERGEIVDGDQLLAMCAQELQRRGELRGKAIASTVMANLGLERALEGMGLGMVRTDVGDRYVVEAMQRDGLNLGGEQSGHIVFLDHITTGDGIISALQVLALLRREKRPLSQLAKVMTRVPQILKNVRVRERVPFDEIPAIAKKIEQVESELEGTGRILVRYSGTEPLARVMVEGDDMRRIDGLADDVCNAIRKALGGDSE